MAGKGSNTDPKKPSKVKATKAAVRLAAMYNLDLEDVPLDEGATKVTVEDVRRHLEANPRGPLPEAGADDAAEAAPKKGVCRVCGCTEATPCPGGCAWTDETQTLCTKCGVKAEAPPPPAPPVQFLTDEPVMVRGKFLGTVVGPVMGGDGKTLFRVKSKSHPLDVETIAYPPEDLTKAL